MVRRDLIVGAVAWALAWAVATARSLIVPQPR